jgi:hypothetical protein
MPLAPMNIRQIPVLGNRPDEFDAMDMDLSAENVSEVKVNPKSPYVKVELPDGSVTISFGGLQKPEGDEDSDFHENIAMHLDNSSLGQVSSELVRLIEQDNESRQELLQQYVMGLDLLGTKIETPRSNASDGSTAVEGQATVRHPLLLESIVRFQANARGELLPSGGPVKIRNDGLSSSNADMQAEALEADFNHYLTVTASEYYPDTERMFFALGFGGTAFKKVYYCPIRRRPVSEFVSIPEIIVSNAETTISTAQRITHVIKMSPSTLKRLQLVGMYRDVQLSSAQPPKNNVVNDKLEQLMGVIPRNLSNTDNQPREIYECYCELDLPGYEHEDDEGPTGLQLPYRVTIDKTSAEILEIRRWWKEDDEQCLRRQVFVDYIFVPGFGFYGLGLLHLVGNTTMALTAGWRLCIDNGMFANFPGFLYAKQAGRQLTNEFRIPPGGGMPIDTAGGPIQSTVMPLPYRSVDGQFLNLLQLIETSGQRMASTSETNVGEGNAEAPVGTTIALIEQAQKVISAVHKRMHAAQAREFQLLKELFKECPEAFWENNKYPSYQWTPETLKAALDNINLVPVADPNTPSHAVRIQKAMAIKQLQMQNPQLYDPQKVDQRILMMLGIEDAADLFVPPMPPQSMPPDPNMISAQAKMMDAQSRMQEVKIKGMVAAAEVEDKHHDRENDKWVASLEHAPKGLDEPEMITAQAKMLDSQAKLEEVKMKSMDAAADAQNRAADRESKERIAMLQLAREVAVHPESASLAEQFIKPDLNGLIKNPEV